MEKVILAGLDLNGAIDSSNSHLKLCFLSPRPFGKNLQNQGCPIHYSSFQFPLQIPKLQVSLVGYTNAGKSTVMNALIDRYTCGEDKKVLEKDMLFATLASIPTPFPAAIKMLFPETLGYPSWHSSEYFQVKNADLLLHVIDYSDASYREHMKVTKETLEELGTGRIPVICVFNKLDLKGVDELAGEPEKRQEEEAEHSGKYSEESFFKYFLYLPASSSSNAAFI